MHGDASLRARFNAKVNDDCMIFRRSATAARALGGEPARPQVLAALHSGRDFIQCNLTCGHHWTKEVKHMMAEAKKSEQMKQFSSSNEAQEALTHVDVGGDRGGQSCCSCANAETQRAPKATQRHQKVEKEVGCTASASQS